MNKGILETSILIDYSKKYLEQLKDKREKLYDTAPSIHVVNGFDIPSKKEQEAFDKMLEDWLDGKEHAECMKLDLLCLSIEEKIENLENQLIDRAIEELDKQ